jgi:hypothetical protein
MLKLRSAVLEATSVKGREYHVSAAGRGASWDCNGKWDFKEDLWLWHVWQFCHSALLLYLVG